MLYFVSFVLGRSVASINNIILFNSERFYLSIICTTDMPVEFGLSGVTMIDVLKGINCKNSENDTMY